MADWCDWSRWGRRVLMGVVIGCAAGRSSVQADLLSTYFPAGVPGYGTSPGVTVASRVRSDFDAPGVRVGSFMLRPNWEQGFGYDSNVFGGPGPRGSWIVGTHPSLLIKSDWSRNALGGYIGVDDSR